MFLPAAGRVEMNNDCDRLSNHATSSGREVNY